MINLVCMSQGIYLFSIFHIFIKEFIFFIFFRCYVSVAECNGYIYAMVIVCILKILNYKLLNCKNFLFQGGYDGNIRTSSVEVRIYFLKQNLLILNVLLDV